MPTTLPEPSRTLMTHVNDRAVDKLGPVLLPVIEDASTIPRHSPRCLPNAPPRRPRRCFCCTAPKTTSSRRSKPCCWHSHYRGKTEVHAVLSGLITHAEVDKSAAATEVWRLVGFWKELMER